MLGLPALVAAAGLLTVSAQTPGVVDDLDATVVPGQVTLNICRHPRLTELPAGIFDGLSKLRTLRIIRNGLTEFSTGVFGNLSHNLDTLELDDNQITNIRRRDLRAMNALCHLDIRGNPGSRWDLTLDDLPGHRSRNGANCSRGGESMTWGASLAAALTPIGRAG